MKKENQKTLLDIVLEEHYIEEKEYEEVLKYIKQKDCSFEEALLKLGFLTKDILGQAIAEYYNLNYLDLNSNPPSLENIFFFSQSFAEKYRVVLIERKEKEVLVTTDNPNLSGLNAVLKKKFSKQKINLHYSLAEDLNRVFLSYRKNLQKRLEAMLALGDDVAGHILIEIVDEALIQGTSDIHLEPRGENVLIRFRIDGILREMAVFSKEYYENLINKIKISANLRIDDHFSAQDGAVRYEKNGKVVDLRISIAPTVQGEKITIRILSKYIKEFSLDNLGFKKEEEESLEESIQKPFGMILVVGPTGSGKTTTLYAVLKKLNTPEINITTIEDPVEYRIESINQMQVNPKTNLTFAKGLRSIVRQDPDVILVGEIRDLETADIAINSALTGHLMLSTFHANDASTAIPRLLDMGIEPFLASSTLELIIAQRLARRICDECKYSVNYNAEELKKINPKVAKFFKEKKVTLYKGKGCPVCGYSGYNGRIGLFEVIKNTPELQNLILKNPSALEIWELAKKQGSKSFFEDGVEKVKKGIISLEELLRVTPLD